MKYKNGRTGNGIPAAGYGKEPYNRKPRHGKTVCPVETAPHYPCKGGIDRL